ncbi:MULTISPECIES: DUF1822 family protein [Cyanophyceae]|uniref:DUF1822 family protein n=1 Tax=Leptolyngbya subtilissima DQ-A4 TaxID=2933933 RepID=A0ABV0K8R1_9CYAN|nr:DUF1822 family protein [Nodosilinea sp. FACHB-141]MBD2110329.1 DUF1822 family protein [Nodosilinea sp. FACHB-141]
MSDALDPINFEFDPLRSTTVTLPSEAVTWAVQIAQRVPDSTQQWSTFLRAMALQGLQQWLESGAVDLALNYDRYQPPDLEIAGRVGNYRLCLVAQGSLSEEVITIPTATLDDASEFAHLYILAEVQEEVNQVTILAGLRRDRLLAQRRTLGLVSQPNGTYRIPIHCFNTTPEDLLLYLTCLNPAQISGPQVSGTETATAPLFTVPQTSPLPTQTRDSINVGRWLLNQLDAVADSLAWTLMPPLAPATALRSMRTPVEQLEDILRDLRPTGVTIPPNARGAYTDLQTMGLPFRLYALTWTLVEPHPPEWTLFLFLGPAPGEQLPPGTRLIMRDATAVLAEQTLAQGNKSGFLYAQAIGTWDEAFTATVELPNGNTLNWPPFVFQPEGADG